uniref:Uncharacterized protein n=1 Tax=Romanomermis culicivorax TaxID=13658 RepID=A0A915JVI5_ROMCU
MLNGIKSKLVVFNGHMDFENMISHLQKLKEVHVENFQIENFQLLSYCITIRVSSFFERKAFIKCEENRGAHTNNIEKLMDVTKARAS